MTIKKTDTPPDSNAFVGRQMCLFQSFLCNGDEESNKLSNTIELWDAAPKYHVGRKKQTSLRKDGFLPSITRDFVHKGRNYIITIRPARITVDESEIEYYPSAREEVVEDALRKIACIQGKGYQVENRSGVSFTLHELRTELKKRGHTLSYYEVTEALNILSGCKVEISPLNEKATYKTSPLTGLAGVTITDLKNDPNSRWLADFSALVTEGIKQMNYRQYNYDLMMSHKSQLARYLHKRLSHNYTQANMLFPYTVTLTTISRDSGLLEYSRPGDNMRKLNAAFDMLKETEILISIEKNEIRGDRDVLIDVKYTLIPHPVFVSEIKKANKRLAVASPEAVGLSHR